MGKLNGQPDARSLTPLGEVRRELDAARRELRCSPFVAEAARAIVSAWDALSQQGDVDAQAEAAPPGVPELELWRDSLSRVRALASRGDEGGAADPVALLDIRDQIDWLSRTLASLEGRRRADARWGARVRNPSLPGVCGVLAVAGLAFAMVAAEPPTPRPWRASFHANPDLLELAAESGQPGRSGVSGAPDRPVIRRQPRIDFAWGRRSPVPGLGVDAFSVRWDACLRVPESRAGGADLRFDLRSDDGARLWLDERLLLTAWRRRGLSEQSGDASLAPGPHHLRVDYRDVAGPASISLEIALDLETDRAPVPTEWLTAPPEPFRSSDPCGLGGDGGPE